MIRLTEVHLTVAAEEAVSWVLRSGQLAQGPVVAEFEDRFARVTETKHAIAMSSGTAALVAAVQALELGEGDEVITTSFTFVATLNAVIEAGATAVLVDVNAYDLTLDPSLVEAAISPATRAVMPVHLYGYPSDMERLAAIAQRHELAVIEDAAQALGATVEGRPVGSFGLGSFSFYATKNITTGEGGMVTTSDDRLADRLRMLRNQGMRGRYHYELPGHNYRMTEIQAAIGVAEIGRLDWVTERRRHNGRQLATWLAAIEGISVPKEDRGRQHAYHQFTIRVSPDARLGRDELRQALAEHGIETGVYYPRPVHEYDCFRSHPQVKVAGALEAARAANEVLSLPVHQWLQPGDLDRIASTMAALLGQ